MYAKFANKYNSASGNEVVRYNLTGTRAEIAEYLEKNPKSVDSVTGAPIFNLTIRPDSVRKDYPIEGPLKVSAKGNFYVDGSAVVNALHMVKQSGADPIELIMRLTGLQGLGTQASAKVDEPASTPVDEGNELNVI